MWTSMQRLKCETLIFDDTQVADLQNGGNTNL